MPTNKLDFGNCNFCNWPLEMREKPIFLTQYNKIEAISDRLFCCHHWQFLDIRFASKGISTFIPSNDIAKFIIYALFFLKRTRILHRNPNRCRTYSYSGAFIRNMYSSDSFLLKSWSFQWQALGVNRLCWIKMFCTKNLHYVKIFFGVA